MKPSIIFSISGGIGKVVMSTAVVKAIAKKYPDHNIITVSGYPDVFLGNQQVYRSFGFGQLSYFYSEYVENKDVKVFAHDPYLETSFIHQDAHVIKIWCEMFGIPYNGELPEIFLTDREKNFHAQKFGSDKPILLMQTNGGADNQALKYSWSRDIPTSVVSEVVKEFSQDYNIVHIKREDQISYMGTTPVSDSFRAIVVLISMSQKRLFMDSFAQHTAASMSLPSTVLWIANKPEVFGYKIHDNIVANPFTQQPELKGSYLQKFDITGDPTQFPYNSEAEIFDAAKVIESLKGEATPM